MSSKEIFDAILSHVQIPEQKGEKNKRLSEELQSKVDKWKSLHDETGSSLTETIRMKKELHLNPRILSEYPSLILKSEFDSAKTYSFLKHANEFPEEFYYDYIDKKQKADYEKRESDAKERVKTGKPRDHPLQFIKSSAKHS